MGLFVFFFVDFTYKGDHTLYSLVTFVIDWLPRCVSLFPSFRFCFIVLCVIKIYLVSYLFLIVMDGSSLLCGLWLHKQGLLLSCGVWT